NWTSSVTHNHQFDLDDFTKTYIKPLGDELEACIFRIATKKIRSRRLEPTCENELPINVFQYIFKIVLSRIDKLLLTLLYSRHIQGSNSSKSRLRLLRWDDVLGHASIASAFPFKDIINTSNICSFLFSENISWNTLETPMEFENIQYLRKKGIIQSLERVGRICWLKLTPETVHLIVVPDYTGTQVWAILEVKSIFEDYHVQSNTNNTINLEVPVDSLHKALKSSVNASDIVLRLTKQDHFPMLSCSISLLGKSGGMSAVTHNIHVRVLSPLMQLSEPVVPEPDCHIILPPLSQLRYISERFRVISNKIILKANMSGEFQIGVSSDLSFESLLFRLKRNQIPDGFQIALETALLLRQVISITRWSHINQLITQIQKWGSKLIEAQPREFISGNIIRRVLFLIREEFNNLSDESLHEKPSNNHLVSPNIEGSECVKPHPCFYISSVGNLEKITSSPIYSSMLNLLGKPDDYEPKNSQKSTAHIGTELKPILIQGIQDIIDELEKTHTDISAQALDHIHSNASKTIEAFLRAAARKRKFTVILAESFPNNQKSSHESITALANTEIDVILIPDAAVFAIMSRVNKVILDAHTVFANGGVLVSAGAKNLAAAAKHHSTPVIICAGIYKFSPLYPHNPDSLIMLSSPNNVIPFDQADLIDTVDIINVCNDYIPPSMIDLYITNLGGHPLSYLSRLIRDHYDPEDTTL
ncbi:hypothetical protein PCK2_000449, partial [Pneumocystis canis]